MNIGLLLLTAVASIAAAPVTVATPAVLLTEQGALVRGQLPAGATGLSLDGKPVRTTADGHYVIGFGRDAPATATLSWSNGNATTTEAVHVAPREWRIQSLPTLPPKPVPDAEFDAKRPAELARIKAARADISDLNAWQGVFIAPANGPVTGVYGSQRILAGIPSAPHAGIDYAAPAGAPVIAPAAGIVRLASGPFLLEGNLVMIDHGFGVVSAFLHLSRLDVKEGDTVRQGQHIGAVGGTGRATGPHLHWAVTWTDVRVDPATLLGAR